MGKFLKSILTVAVIAGLGYVYQDKLLLAFAALSNRYFPCSIALTYRIGSFDERFGITKPDLLGALASAEAVWEKGAGKNLFDYSVSGTLAVNLIYDYRQQATEKLDQYGSGIEDSEAGYNVLKAKYQTLQNDYNNEKQTLDALAKTYEQLKKTYEQEVAAANRRGGASKTEYDKLEAERQALNDQAAELQKKQEAFNKLVADLNALASALNRMAADLNLKVDEFNTISRERGEEFQEGVYKQNGLETEIDIYEFASTDQLMRLLAHEMGHALGLGHVEDPEAIMYRLNQAKNSSLTAADLAELKNHCQ